MEKRRAYDLHNVILVYNGIQIVYNSVLMVYVCVGSQFCYI